MESARASTRRFPRLASLLIVTGVSLTAAVAAAL